MTKIFGHASLRGVWTLVFFAGFLFLIAFNDQYFSSAQRTSKETAILSGTISGKVFDDFNSNGAFDTASGLNSVDIGFPRLQ